MILRAQGELKASTAKRKKASSKALPPNLYEYNGYYKYRNPLTGKSIGFGKNRQDAINAAIETNLLLLAQQREIDFIQRATVSENTIETSVSVSVSVSALIERYKCESEQFAQLKTSTKKEDMYRLNRLQKMIGDKKLIELDVRFIAEFLKTNFENNARTKMRSLFVKLCNFAVGSGLMENNTAEKTLKGVEKKRARGKMTMTLFNQIYERAEPFLQIAMKISLLTLLRRGDIEELRYDDIKDGYLYVEVNKSETSSSPKRLAFEVSEELKAIISESKCDGIISPYIVHRKPTKFYQDHGKDHWSKVNSDYITKAFKKIRNSLPEMKNIPVENRPTFHEIRSLGGYLLIQKGFSKSEISIIMGHSSTTTTDIYLTKHDKPWEKVAISKAS